MTQIGFINDVCDIDCCWRTSTKWYNNTKHKGLQASHFKALKQSIANGTKVAILGL